MNTRKKAAVKPKRMSTIDRIQELTSAIECGYPEIILSRNSGKVMASVKNSQGYVACSDWIDPGAGDVETLALKSLEASLRAMTTKYIADKRREICRAEAALKAK